jgi:hypothetical protein
MVSWLAKTTQLLQRRQSPEPPAPYDIACTCGHHVSGVRQSTFQSVRCHRCGDVLFVLPNDVYPRPKPKKVPPPNAPPAPVHESVSRAKAVQPVPVPAAPAKAPYSAKTVASAAAATSNPAPARRDEPSTADSVTVIVRRPLVNRFRLVLLAIGIVVTATGYFVWQSRLNDQALVSLPGHVEAGAAALRAGDVPKAAEEYRQAAWAVDRLGREDAESLGVRQKAKELGAIVNLSTVPLFDICDDARRTVKDRKEDWSEKFDKLYRDSWIVVEGDVIQDTGSDGVGQAMVRFPFPIDSAPVVIDGRLQALGPVSGKNALKHVIFAGQLASLSKEGTKNPIWMIRLKDETAFLWGNVETYQALGLSPDTPGDANDARHILSQQASAIGLKP